MADSPRGPGHSRSSSHQFGHSRNSSYNWPLFGEELGRTPTDPRSSISTAREEVSRQQRFVRPSGPRLVEIRHSRYLDEDASQDQAVQDWRSEQGMDKPRDSAYTAGYNAEQPDEEPPPERGNRKRSNLEDQNYGAPDEELPPDEGDQGRDHIDDRGYDSVDDAVPPSFSRRTPSDTDGHQSQHKPSGLVTQIYIYCYLIFFSFLGTLSRLGVQWLTFYPGAPVVTPVLWANVGGSLIMGFLAEDFRLFRDEWGNTSSDEDLRARAEEKAAHDLAAAKKDHAKVKKTIPLYVGLATGFCGSFTSFSSFERDIFLALSNDLPTPDNHPVAAGATLPAFTSTVPRNGGYSFLALLAIIFLTIGMSLAAIFVGAHLALALDRFTPTIPFRLTRRIIDPLIAFLALGSWLAAILLAIFPPDRPSGPSSRGSWTNEVWRGEVLFALVFAPLGAMLRYYASLKLNPLVASFPLGTFAVNVFGTAVLGMCYDLQHAPLLSTAGMMSGGGRVGCQVLQGIMDGFCGCLTTVSTFVAELQGLRKSHAYVYGLASVLSGLAVLVVVMGSVRWSVGWSETACVTMRTSS